MSLSALKPTFRSKAAAIGLGAMFALSPAYAAAQEAPASGQATLVANDVSPVGLVEDAGMAAGRYSEQHPGIVVAVHLGTHSTTPAIERIKEVLSEDFRKAGVTDPITFFFTQNDVPGSAAEFYYSGYVDGPFSLGEAREQAAQTAQSYNWRKERGLVASLDLN